MDRGDPRRHGDQRPPYLTRRPYVRRIIGGQDIRDTGGHAMGPEEKILDGLDPIDAPNIGPEWSIWRVVDAGLASGIEEIDRHWSLDEVLDANEYLDAKNDLEGLRLYAREIAAEQRREREQAAALLGGRGGVVEGEVDDEVAAELRETLGAATGHDPALLASLLEALGVEESDDGPSLGPGIGGE